MQVSKEFVLCASHIVPNHPGKCRRLHGHNWKITVTATGQVRKDTGMVIDFNDLKRVVSPIIERLDHQHLNFFIKYPTAENLALYIAREIVVELGATLEVRIKETDKTEAVFRGAEDFYNLELTDGWQEPFKKFVAFQDRKAMSKWVHDHQRKLEDLYAEMHWVGAELASFEMYKASLDEHEAAKLLAELHSYTDELTASVPSPMADLNISKE